MGLQADTPIKGKKVDYVFIACCTKLPASGASAS